MSALSVVLIYAAAAAITCAAILALCVFLLCFAHNAIARHEEGPTQ